jgi:hypothetical protein
MLLKRLAIVFLCGALIGPADARSRRPALMGNSVPIWVKSGATVDMSFSTGQYYGCSLASCLSITRGSSKTNLLPSSASGFIYSTFGNNVLAITPGSGLLVEEGRTNQLLNSAAPATQTTGSLGTGTYTLWVNGSGSATMSLGTGVGCGTGTATNGTPVNFTITVAGTCIVTVIGSLNFEQLELGTFGTSGIVTTGAAATRAADIIKLTSTPSFGAAYSIFVQANPQAPSSYSQNQAAVGITDGSANNRLQLYRTSATGNAGALVSSGGVAQYNQTNGSWAQNVSGKMAAAITSGDQESAFNGVLLTAGTGAFMPVSVNTVTIGALIGTSAAFDGFIQRVAIWPATRISNTNLQAFTT